MPESRSVKSIPPIWVINLGRATDRRQVMNSHLDAMGLEYEIIDAVDGQKLSKTEMRSYSSLASLWAIKRTMMRSEIGCFLSHCQAWKRMIDEELEEVLILEDDAFLTRDFFEIIQRRNQFPPDWDCINFFTSAGQHIFGDPLWDIYRMCRFYGFVNSNTCLLLNLSGAKKLVEKSFPIRYSADSFVSACEKTGLRYYGIHPSPVGLHLTSTSTTVQKRKSLVWASIFRFKKLVLFMRRKAVRRS